MSQSSIPQNPADPAGRGGVPPAAAISHASVPFEKLHRTFVFLRRLARLERAEVAALAGLRIGLAGVEAVFAGFEFADHMQLGSRRRRDAAAPAAEDGGAPYNFSTTVPSTKAS